MVVWKKECLSKKFCGRNVRSCKLWNLASMGKLNWLVFFSKKNVLWVRRIHGMYMRNGIDIKRNFPSMDFSWYYSKLNKINQAWNWYNIDVISLNASGRYSISGAYVELVGPRVKLEIADLGWSMVMLPTKIIVTCLAILGKLLTNDRMINTDIPHYYPYCSLCKCNELETPMQACL